MPIALTDLLQKTRIQLHLRSTSQEGALKELVELLGSDGALQRPGQFLELVVKRESANTTLADHGVAFPHARTDALEEIVLAVGRSEAGVPWPEAANRAHLIFLIGVPQNLINDYLVAIGLIARTTKDKALRTLLLHAETADDFIATMLAAPSI